MSLKFGQIQLPVPMATDRVIMEKQCCHFFSAVFYPILFILAGNDDMHHWRSLKFSEIRLLTAELAALERLKKSHRLIMGKMVLPLFPGCS